MTYEEEQKKLKKLRKQTRISREDLLFMINLLEQDMNIEGYSTLLNWKESLGFNRHD